MGVDRSKLRSFTIVLPKNGLAGWKIATAKAGTSFQAHLVGDSLEETSAQGTRSLG
jgi:hypothetical protein